MKKITGEDILKILDLDLDVEFINETCGKLAEENTNYELAQGFKRDRIVIDILEKLNSELSQSGDNRRNDWKVGWDQNLEALISTHDPIASLIPGYYRPNYICRWMGEYIISASPDLEFTIFKALRRIIFHKFVKDGKYVYEFGAGSAHNLVYLSSNFSHLELHALDWANPTSNIADYLRTNFGINVFGHKFDFFNPTLVELDEPNETVFLTIGGLEQTGPDCGEFIDFLFSCSPKIIVHIEPIFEFYENPTTNLVEYLGAQFHKKRKYLDGYLTSINKLVLREKAEIIYLKKFPFGGNYHDGWSILVWRTKNG